MVALGQGHGFWEVILDSTDPETEVSIPEGKERLAVDSQAKFQAQDVTIKKGEDLGCPV